MATPAEGVSTEFAGAVSKFIVAHPKTAVIVAAVLAFVAGWLLH